MACKHCCFICFSCFPGFLQFDCRIQWILQKHTKQLRHPKKNKKTKKTMFSDYATWVLISWWFENMFFWFFCDVSAVLLISCILIVKNNEFCKNIQNSWDIKKKQKKQKKQCFQTMQLGYSYPDGLKTCFFVFFGMSQLFCSFPLFWL